MVEQTDKWCSDLKATRVDSSADIYDLINVYIQPLIPSYVIFSQYVFYKAARTRLGVAADV